MLSVLLLYNKLKGIITLKKRHIKHLFFPTGSAIFITFCPKAEHCKLSC